MNYSNQHTAMVLANIIPKKSHRRSDYYKCFCQTNIGSLVNMNILNARAFKFFIFKFIINLSVHLFILVTPCSIGSSQFLVRYRIHCPCSESPNTRLTGFPQSFLISNFIVITKISEMGSFGRIQVFQRHFSNLYTNLVTPVRMVHKA